MPSNHVGGTVNANTATWDSSAATPTKTSEDLMQSNHLNVEMFRASGSVGAKTITNTILGVPCYKYIIVGPKILF